MSNEDARRRRHCRVYLMSEEQANQWNVSEVPRWFIEQLHRTELVAGFIERCRRALREAEVAA